MFRNIDLVFDRDLFYVLEELRVICACCQFKSNANFQKNLFSYIFSFVIWSENNQEDDFQIYVAKIPKIYIPSVLMSESESKEMNKRIRGADIEVKPTTKASPILRPRAVVSSPGIVVFELLFYLCCHTMLNFIYRKP